jgi:hypothetical protein
MQMEKLQDRESALADLESQMKERMKQVMSPATVVSRFIIGSRTAVAESVGDLLIGLLSPHARQLQQAEERSRIRRDLMLVGLALGEFRIQRGAYPKTLNELKPDFLKQIPVDPYAEKPLLYQLRPNGFVVYSLGPNRKDDGGSPLKSGPVQDEGDLIFEVPPKLDE